MPFEFHCPYCGGATTVAEEFAGQRGPCIHCGREIEIPAAAAPREGSRQVENPRRRALLRAGTFGLALVAMVCLVAAMIVAAIPVWRQARDIALQQRSAANLRKIGLALRAYETDFGCYPPAYTVGADGKPLLSWRVLILPYLDDNNKQLYELFDQKQPWNSPQNMQLLRQMPDVFVHPGDETAKAAKEASYLAFVGPNTMFPLSDTRRQIDVRDERSSTILLIETTVGAIKWTEPQDIDVTATDFQLQGGVTPYLGGLHPNGAQALFSDGDVGVIPLGTNAAVIEAMTTIDGGEAVGR